MQYRRNSIIDRVNEIYVKNFISDLVIKNKPDKNKINYDETASNNITKLQCQTSHEAQVEKKQNLEDALAKLGKNIKEKRKMRRNKILLLLFGLIFVVSAFYFSVASYTDKSSHVNYLFMEDTSVNTENQSVSEVSLHGIINR